MRLQFRLIAIMFHASEGCNQCLPDYCVRKQKGFVSVCLTTKRICELRFTGTASAADARLCAPGGKAQQSKLAPLLNYGVHGFSANDAAGKVMRC